MNTLSYGCDECHNDSDVVAANHHSSIQMPVNGTINIAFDATNPTRILAIDTTVSAVFKYNRQAPYTYENLQVVTSGVEVNNGGTESIVNDRTYGSIIVLPKVSIAVTAISTKSFSW